MSFKCAQPAHIARNMQLDFDLKAGFEAWCEAKIKDPQFPSQDAFMANLQAWIESDGWLINGGQYIPKFSEFIKKQRYLIQPFVYTNIPKSQPIPKQPQSFDKEYDQRIQQALKNLNADVVAKATQQFSQSDINTPLNASVLAAQKSAEKNGFLIKQVSTEAPETPSKPTSMPAFLNNRKPQTQYRENNAYSLRV